MRDKRVSGVARVNQVMFITMTPDNAIPDLSGLAPRTRERIEEALLNVFSTREFHKVGMAEIAREARVSLQTLYKYYGSKEALLYSGLDHWMAQVTERMLDHLQGIQTYKDRLRKGLWGLLDFYDRNPKVGLLMQNAIYFNAWSREPALRQPQFTHVFIQVLTEGRAAGVLTDEVDERDLLDVFYGVAARVISQWLSRGMREPLAARADALFELIWRAIAKPGAEAPE